MSFRSSDTYGANPGPRIRTTDFMDPALDPDSALSARGFQYRMLQKISHKMIKRSHKTVEIKVFLTFLLDYVRIRIRIGTNNYGSGSRRLIKLRIIRTRVHSTDNEGALGNSLSLSR